MQGGYLSHLGGRPARQEVTETMSHKPQAKMDARTAWNTWSEGGSPGAGAEFLQRVESWTDGTAAQIARADVRSGRTRDEIVDRLRYHLGLAAVGGPLTYTEALDRARREVIAELRQPS